MSLLPGCIRLSGLFSHSELIDITNLVDSQQDSLNGGSARRKAL
jgi:hypothetical protein